MEVASKKRSVEEPNLSLKRIKKLEKTESLSMESRSVGNERSPGFWTSNHSGNINVSEKPETATEVISFEDIGCYIVRRNHNWLIEKFPNTFGGCTLDLLTENFAAAAYLCSRVSQDGHEVTVEDFKQIVDRLKLSGPREFTVNDLSEYFLTEDHHRLIRKYQPFLNCTSDLLEDNFSAVSDLWYKLRKGGHKVTDEELQRLVDLIRSPKID